MNKASCNGIRDLLSPYLEDELSAESRHTVEEHLQACADCRADLELLRVTVDTLHSLPELQAPAGILQGVREGVESHPWHRRLIRHLAGRWQIRIPVGAAATLLVAFGVFLLYDRFPELGRVPEPPVQPSPAEVNNREEVGKNEHVRMRSELDEMISTRQPEPAVAEPIEEKAAAADLREIRESAPSPPSSSPALPVSGKTTSRTVTPPPPRQDKPSAIVEVPAAPPEPVPQLTPDAYDTPAIPETRPAAPPPAKPVPALEAPPTSAEPAGHDRDTFEKDMSAVGALEDHVVAKERATSPRPQRHSKVIPAPAYGKRKMKAPAEAEEFSSFADTGDKVRRKSLPLRGEGGAARSLSAFRELPAMEGKRRIGEESARSIIEERTEILTIVSLRENEVGRLRSSITEAGGRLLEMKTLDTLTSQQVALPYQNQIRRNNVISQGWQIRALVPYQNVEKFMASLGRQPDFQLLDRSTAPATWTSDPGTQTFEINLVR